MLYVLIAVAVVFVLAVSLGIRTVPQGQVWTVERFGRFVRLLQPGLNLMTPFVERIGHEMNVQEIVLDIPEQADGRVAFRDGTWLAHVVTGPSPAAGAPLRIMGLKGTTLLVATE